MSAPDVHIVRLEPMRVASAYGFGEHPEEQAWRQLDSWARPKGLLDDILVHPIFGFNNPNPSQATRKYGYEFWIRVGPGVEPEGQVRIVEFLGGTYAVARFEVLGHPEILPEGWQSLIRWCKENKHAFAHQQALEGFLGTPDNLDHLVLNLYCPIVG